MTKQERVIELLLEHRKPDVEMDEDRLRVLLGQEDPNADVDWVEVQDALGYSSLQLKAFLNSLNEEFGKEISPEAFMSAKGTAGFMALVE